MKASCRTPNPPLPTPPFGGGLYNWWPYYYYDSPDSPDSHLNLRNCDWVAKRLQVLASCVIPLISGIGGKYKTGRTPSTYICSNRGWFDKVRGLWSKCLDRHFTTTLPRLSKVASEKLRSYFNFAGSINAHAQSIMGSAF